MVKYILLEGVRAIQQCLVQRFFANKFSVMNENGGFFVKLICFCHDLHMTKKLGLKTVFLPGKIVSASKSSLSSVILSISILNDR